MPYTLPQTAPISPIRQRWESGGVQVEASLYRATPANVWIEDLSDHLLDWTVTWNEDKGAGDKLALKLQIDSRTILEEYQDWVAPVLKLTWADGVVEGQQFGLFRLDMPVETIYAEHAIVDYEGFDPTLRIYDSVVRDTYNVATGGNRADALRTVMSGVWPRVVVPQSSSTFDANKTWLAFTSRFAIASAIAEGLSVYQPFPDLTGQIVTRPIVDIAQESPVLALDEGDFQGTLKVVPTTTTLANIVVVRKSGINDAAPIQSIAENNDPSDSISLVNRQPIIRWIDSNDIQTQAEADALAAEYLRQGSSFYRVVTGELPPGTWMRPHQVVDLTASHPEWGSLSGRYRLRTWEVGAQPSDNVKIEMSRVLAFNDRIE